MRGLTLVGGPGTLAPVRHLALADPHLLSKGVMKPIVPYPSIAFLLTFPCPFCTPIPSISRELSPPRGGETRSKTPGGFTLIRAAMTVRVILPDGQIKEEASSNRELGEVKQRYEDRTGERMHHVVRRGCCQADVCFCAVLLGWDLSGFRSLVSGCSDIAAEEGTMLEYDQQTLVLYPEYLGHLSCFKVMYTVRLDP